MTHFGIWSSTDTFSGSTGAGLRRVVVVVVGRLSEPFGLRETGWRPPSAGLLPVPDAGLAEDAGLPEEERLFGAVSRSPQYLQNAASSSSGFPQYLHLIENISPIIIWYPQSDTLVL